MPSPEVLIVAEAFSKARGDDLTLGKSFTDDPHVTAAFASLEANPNAQEDFVAIFDAKHRGNEAINLRIKNIVDMFKEMSQPITRFQAISYVIRVAQFAYNNGGPT